MKTQTRRPTLKQIKLARLIKENSGKKGGTKSMGKLMLEAGYTKASAKTPSLITQSPVIAEVLDDVISVMKDKRRMALTHMTEKKFKKTGVLSLAYVADLLTKNAQLLEGKATANVAHAMRKYSDAELEHFAEGSQG